MVVVSFSFASMSAFSPPTSAARSSGVIRRPARVEQLGGEHLALAVERVEPARGEPDQGPAPVVRVGLALEQALGLELRDDVADHRLRPVQVLRRLADGQRARVREVQQHGPGRPRHLRTLAVAPVEAQVRLLERVLELPRELLGAGHDATVPPARSIVNPDTFAATDRWCRVLAVPHPGGGACGGMIVPGSR